MGQAGGGAGAGLRRGGVVPRLANVTAERGGVRETLSQKMREAEVLERIERARQERIRRAKIRHYRRTGETCHNWGASQRTDEEVAQVVGLGYGETYRKAKKVWEAVNRTVRFNS